MKLKRSIYLFLQQHVYLLLVAAVFFTLSFVIDTYWSASNNIAAAAGNVESFLKSSKKDLNKVLSQKDFLAAAIEGTLTEDQTLLLNSKPWFVFFYKRDSDSTYKLSTWSTQTILPTQSITYAQKTSGFALLANGYYVWEKKHTNTGFYISMYPVKWNYIVTNNYLKNTIPAFGNTSNVQYQILAGRAAAGNVNFPDSEPLFHLVSVKNNNVLLSSDYSVFARLMGFLFCLFFLHLAVSYLTEKKGLAAGALVLFVSLVCIRIAGYTLNFPANFEQSQFFNATALGKTVPVRSIVNLLLNALFFLWFVIFVRINCLKQDLQIRIRQQIRRYIFLAVAAMILLAATFSFSAIIVSLIANSQISFDVINFFSLDRFSLAGFLALCFLGTGYYFFCSLILYISRPLQHERLFFFLCIVFFGLLIQSFQIGNKHAIFNLYVLLWLILFVLLMQSDRIYLLATRYISSRMVFWIFFFSASITGIIISENNHKEILNRREYAQMLASKTNATTETLINSLLTNFRTGFLTENFNRFLLPQDNRTLKDSLRNNNFSGFTNRFNTKIYTYTAAEKPLFNEDEQSYNDLNTVLNTQGKATGIEGLFYYDLSFDKYGYLSKKVIPDTAGNVLGYVFVQISPRAGGKNEAVMPELFSRGYYNALETSSEYAFALYNNNRLTGSHNDYAFATVISPDFFKGNVFKSVQKSSYNELWYNAGAGKIVVIVKQRRVFLQSITLFSYLFCSFLILTALVWLANTLLMSRFKISRIRDHFSLNIRSQIHGTIIFFSVISFLIIGIATIIFFINRYESNNREKLSNTIRIMEGEILKSNWKLAETVQADSASLQNLDQSIRNISEIHSVDVNLYDTDGNLQLSSLPLPYTKGIISTKMNPLAYEHLHNLKEIQFFQKESIGRLNYLSSYVPLFTKAGAPNGFLNIPYFTSQSKLREEISNFLVTIINLNAFIFLIAGIVALFITNKITSSFILIEEKMKQVNLGSRNEAITWNSHDEIGNLVQEFNKMVAKLDESAAALAKSEREDAWKEMARQVAHEIKNPLTPMKLSMQFLQRAVANDSGDIKNLAASVANTLIEQIDHLSRIAGDFGQFSNIAHARKEVFDARQVLMSLQTLYAADKDVELEWHLPEEEMLIYADKTHINRLFTNLIKNAMQSFTDTSQAKVMVAAVKHEQDILVTVADNGAGIAEDIRPRIFTPNFTTKSSGTGLGLAMCKRIAEQAGGDIWFETNSAGTTFFVRLPLYFA